MNRLLIVFAKSPTPGLVKTRIGASIGMKKAAIIFTKLLKIAIAESATNELWQQLIAITPESDEDYFQKQMLQTVRQKGQSLGERISNAFLLGFETGAEQVMVIGSDIPALNRAQITNAYHLLNKFPAVIGPSTDGGFYLFGVSHEYCKTAAHIFLDNIAWSTSKVFDEVKKLCQKEDLPLFTLPEKRDIDTYEDWIAYNLENAAVMGYKDDRQQLP